MEIEAPTGRGDLLALLAPFGRRLGSAASGSCVDGPQLARDFFRMVDRWPCGHVSGLLMRLRPQALMGTVDRDLPPPSSLPPLPFLDGELHALGLGDGVAFPAGTGIAHCFLNNTEGAVRLLIIGERHLKDRVAYPLNPERRAAPNNWSDAPKRSLGKHDGRPKKRA